MRRAVNPEICSGSVWVSAAHFASVRRERMCFVHSWLPFKARYTKGHTFPFFFFKRFCERLCPRTAGPWEGKEICDLAELTQHIHHNIKGALRIASSAGKEVRKDPFPLPLIGGGHSMVTVDTAWSGLFIVVIVINNHVS